MNTTVYSFETYTTMLFWILNVSFIQ